MKDLYAGGAYNRELAEIIEVPNLDLSEKITAYPNPFKDQIILAGEKEILSQNIEVLSLTGKDVTDNFNFITLTENRIKITPKNKLKKGIYIIKISTDDYFVSKKIIRS